MPMQVNGVLLSDVAIQYLETILWAETCMLPVPEEELVNGRMDVDLDHPLCDVYESDPLDTHFGINDFTAESLERVREDVGDFFDQAEHADLIDRAHRFADDERIAHDFWLTRNGHGAGFWDGDYKDDTDDVGEPLSELARTFSECNVIVGEDGCLHIEG
jgi:hypothetical protein